MKNWIVPLIIRRNQLKAVVGLSPSTVDRLESAADFPPRKRFSNGCVGWHGPAVMAWAEEKAKKVE